jgi:phosphoglycolate phosphatase-like HAD superfamily hydrolase
MVGDKLIDVLAGFNAGVRSIIVKTGYGMQEVQALKKMDTMVAVATVDNIFAAYLFIKNEVLRKQMEGK